MPQKVGRACHTQNGSGYETFYRVKMVPKKVSTLLLSFPIADSVAGARQEGEAHFCRETGGRTRSSGARWEGGRVVVARGGRAEVHFWHEVGGHARQV